MRSAIEVQGRTMTFRMLIRVSNDNNVALRSVAQDLASTGLWIGKD